MPGDIAEKKTVDSSAGAASLLMGSWFSAVSQSFHKSNSESQAILVQYVKTETLATASYQALRD
jgi:hypothetical protein